MLKDNIIFHLISTDTRFERQFRPSFNYCFTNIGPICFDRSRGMLSLKTAGYSECGHGKGLYVQKFRCNNWRYKAGASLHSRFQKLQHQRPFCGSSIATTCTDHGVKSPVLPWCPLALLQECSQG